MNNKQYFDSEKKEGLELRSRIYETNNNNVRNPQNFDNEKNDSNSITNVLSYASNYLYGSNNNNDTNIGNINVDTVK